MVDRKTRASYQSLMMASYANLQTLITENSVKEERPNISLQKAPKVTNYNGVLHGACLSHACFLLEKNNF